MSRTNPADPHQTRLKAKIADSGKRKQPASDTEDEEDNQRKRSKNNDRDDDEEDVIDDDMDDDGDGSLAIELEGEIQGKSIGEAAKQSGRKVHHRNYLA